MNEITRDPMPDPELRELLGALDAPPAAEVDWERLRASVNERAELPLARRRRTQRSGSRWLRPVLPAAAAAALAAIVATQIFRTEPAGVEAGNGDVAIGFHPVVEEVLGTSITEMEMDLLFGQVSADMLVVAAVDRP
jgi:hypothetical protein